MLPCAAVDGDRKRLKETLRRQGIDEHADAAQRLVPPTLAPTLEAGVVEDEAAERQLNALPRARVDTERDSDFVLSHELGRGGMGQVLLATQAALQREVAVKRLLDASPDQAALLLHEASVAGQLEHPNIVPVHALVATDEGPAVVMKRVSGVGWNVLIEEGETSIRRHLEILRSVVNAVAFAHSRGVLHRDIKPENVMIGDFGEVYLLDWGLAGGTMDDPAPCVLGTPAYLAPEMAEGKSSEQSDVFLLGSCLHEVLTGEPRHSGADVLETLAVAMQCEPVVYGADVPQELERICNRACAKEPSERFDSVLEMRDALAAYQKHSASNQLTETGRLGLAAMRERIASDPGDGDTYAEVQGLFGGTRFAFQQALATWGDSQAALSGMRDSEIEMASYELKLGHVDSAAALLESMERPPQDLLEHVRRAREQAEQAEGRLAQLERELDPSVGATGRNQAWLALSMAVFAMTSAIVALRLLRPDFTPSTSRLAVVGAIVLVVVGTMVSWWRRRAGYNLVNRAIAQISLGGVAASFLFRLAGFLGGFAPETVLVADAFLLGLAGLALSMFHRAGAWLAVGGFAVGFTGALYPAWVDDLFIGLTLAVASAALALRLASRR